MKRFAIAALTVMAVLVALWTGGWLFAADQIRKGVASLEEADGVTSPYLACASLDISGFPFRFDIACGQANLVSGDLTATLPLLHASALIYRPSHVIASAHGPLTLTDAFTGSASEVSWEGMELSARLEGWRIGRVSLIGNNVNWTDALFGALIGSTAQLEAHLLDIPERHDSEAGLAALAGYAALTGVVAPGLGVTEGQSELELELSGLPDDVRVLVLGDALQRWQQAGGALTIVNARGVEGASVIEGTGTLSLDSAARLEGQVNLTSNGVVERTGTLFQEPVKSLILGQPAEDGTYKQTLNIRSGVVFSGVVPAATIPPLY